MEIWFLIEVTLKTPTELLTVDSLDEFLSCSQAYWNVTPVSGQHCGLLTFIIDLNFYNFDVIMKTFNIIKKDIDDFYESKRRERL